MIDFKGAHYPRSVILFTVYSTYATVSPTATWKRSWRNLVYRSIMQP